MEDEERDREMLSRAPTVEVARVLRIRQGHRKWLLELPRADALMGAITREDGRIARAREELARRAGE